MSLPVETTGRPLWLVTVASLLGVSVLTASEEWAFRPLPRGERPDRFRGVSVSTAFE